MKQEPCGKILIVGTQGQVVTSGPGTFMRYVCEAIDEKRLVAEVLYPNFRKGTAFGDRDFVHFSFGTAVLYNRFFGSWVLVSFLIWFYLSNRKAFARYKQIWFADRFSAFFSILIPSVRRKCVVMVNDDSRILSAKASTLESRFDVVGYARKSIACAFFSVERFLCSNAGLVITNSDYLTELIFRSYNVPKTRIYRLYKAVDLSKFPARERRGFPGSLIKVLFIKNEWERGGLDILLGALARLQGKRFQLVIAGMEGESTVQRIRSIALSVGFLGELDFRGVVARQNVCGLFHEADMFCVPSRSEALGVSFMEALSTGTPVIATNTGGLPEVLDYGKAGWLVTPGSVLELASAIQSCVTDADLRDRYVNHGLSHVRTFSSERMISAIDELAGRDLVTG